MHVYTIILIAHSFILQSQTVLSVYAIVYTHVHLNTPPPSSLPLLQGDTLQNVANELDCIISTGYYIFTLSQDSSGGMSAQIMLEYKPSTSSPQTQPHSHSSSGTPSHGFSSSSEHQPLSFEEAAAIPPERTLPRILLRTESQQLGHEIGQKLSNMERWNTEQIGDFVRKLGFLDKEKDREGGDKIKHFLHVNEVITC